MNTCKYVVKKSFAHLWKPVALVIVKTLKNPLNNYQHKVNNIDTIVSFFTSKEWLIDFTLFNARWFYLSQGDPIGVKGLKKNYIFLPKPFTP